MKIKINNKNVGNLEYQFSSHMVSIFKINMTINIFKVVIKLFDYIDNKINF